MKRKGANCPLSIDCQPSFHFIRIEKPIYKNEKPKNVRDNEEKIKSSSVNFMSNFL